LHSFAKVREKFSRIERCPGPTGEDQSVLPPGGTGRHLALSLPGVMLAQLGHDLRGQRQRPPGARSFQLADDELGPVARLPVAALDPLDTMSDLEGPGVPVQGRPARAEHLTAAHRVRQREDDDQLEAVTSCSIKAAPAAPLARRQRQAQPFPRPAGARRAKSRRHADQSGSLSGQAGAVQGRLPRRTIIQLVATASMAALRAVACERLSPAIDPVATHLEIGACRGGRGWTRAPSGGSAAGAPLAGGHQADADSG
jgi:hypothetical protein